MKPQKLRRILAGGLGLLLVVLLLFLWNGTAGNPISALIATRNITAYVKETYPGANFSEMCIRDRDGRLPWIPLRCQ